MPVVCQHVKLRPWQGLSAVFVSAYVCVCVSVCVFPVHRISGLARLLRYQGATQVDDHPWDTSEHCAHLRKHPQSYQLALAGLLARAKVRWRVLHPACMCRTQCIATRYLELCILYCAACLSTSDAHCPVCTVHVGVVPHSVLIRTLTLSQLNH